MSTEIATQSDNHPSPFGQGRSLLPGANVGAVAIEQERAIAEAQGQMVLAKRFPRSTASATAELREACKSLEFASTAFYAVPNRGSGPSIRLAEEVARCYGNFQYGHKELSRTPGQSEIEVFAWDMERNNHSRRQITVLHIVDTKHGPKKLVDQADIDNRIANVASKQMRGRILALLPKSLVAMAVEECRKTLAGNNDEPISARVNRMTAAFAKMGVTDKMLAKYIGHGLDSVTSDELVDLTGVHTAIKEGAKPSEYFTPDDEDAAAAGVEAVKKMAEANKAAAPAPASAPAPSPAPAPAAAKQASKPPAQKPAATPPPAPQKPAEPGPEAGQADDQNADETGDEPDVF
jgi:hypothetical protein